MITVKKIFFVLIYQNRNIDSANTLTSMKHNLLLLCILSLTVNAQQKKSSTTFDPSNFYSIRDKFYGQFDKDDLKPSANEKEEPQDGILEKFHRWEWLMTPRTFPTGTLPDPAITSKEMAKYRQAHPEMNTMRNSNWFPIGTAVVPANGGGAGRINAVRFDPNTSDIIYLGTAGGGVWKSTTNGSWQPLSDFLPVTSIADVAIDPTNTNTIYAATGDGYGYELNWQSDNDFWGGTYTAGVFKSIDGGGTWSPTGLSFEQSNLEIVQRLVIHPTNPNKLLAATRAGIYYTGDAGVTWSLVDSTHCYDFAFNTAHPDTVYTAGNKDLLWSTDGGATWSILYDNVIGQGRVSIETSAANPDVIYLLNEGGSFKRSSDGGLTWQNKQTPTAGFYGYYDSDFDVSSANENYLIAGGIYTAISNNGGTSWQTASVNAPYTASDYVHADGHCVRFLPGSTDVIFSGNDGGIFKSVDFGTNWTDLSNGLMIGQAYRMSSSETNPDVMYSGWQDNGSNKWDGTNWAMVNGPSDGMGTRVDYTDENIAYIETQYGGLYKTTNGGLTWAWVSPAGGDWITPFIIDPVDHNTLYYGGSYEVYKTTNGGSSWTSLNANLGGSCFWVEAAASDNNYVYACALNKIKRSSDAGGSWTDVTGTLPVGTVGMNYIAINNNDPMSLWVAFSGYSDGNKVFHSEDGGATWTNVSGTLPNVPVNTIVYENDSPDGLYIGTDVGVFYRDNNLADWIPYMTGLPNVMVHELEINYAAGKLRAATYGRGLWESDLYYYVQYVNDIGVTSVIWPTADVCTDQVAPQVKVKNFGSAPVTSFDVSYSIDGGSPNISNWNVTIAPNGYTILTLPPTNVPGAGVHTLTVTTENPNGISDNNLVNDADTVTFNSVAAGMPLPFQEGFESSLMPPPNWTVENDNHLWSDTIAVGGFGNSVYSAKGNCHDVVLGTDALTTPYLDFSGAAPPLHFTFDWAHANHGPYRADTLRIQISTDCGFTWTDLFYKGGDSLASVPYQTPPYIPAVADWKLENIDLTSYSSFSKILIRFKVISDHGNNLYVDDINISSTPLNTETPISYDKLVVVYPNPTNGMLNVFIPTSQHATSISICNLLGEEMISSAVTNTSQVSLDVSSQANGMYFVKVISEKGMEMVPFVLQR